MVLFPARRAREGPGQLPGLPALISVHPEAEITEIEGASHVVMISRAREVAEVVMTAARTCVAQPA